MGQMTVVMRRWRYSDRGMALVYTKEYLQVMRKLKTEDIASFKHSIVEPTKELIRDGTPYDIVKIKTKRLTNKAA